MKTSRILLSSCCLLGAFQPALGANAGMDDAKKNILFLAIDDFKPILGCFGDSLAITPNIDQLVSRGTLFTGAYCQQAVSGPTRASLLTGMCPDRTRVWDLKTLIRKENPDVVTLPQYFKENGYTTWGIGKIFDQRSVDKKKDVKSWSLPFTDGWEFINEKYSKPALGSYQAEYIHKGSEKLDKEMKRIKGKSNDAKRLSKELGIKPTTEALNIEDDAYQDGAIAKGAIQFLQNYNDSKPFFLAVGLRKPHLPFVAPKKYWDLFDRESMPLASFKRKAAFSPEFAYHTSGELHLYSDIPPLTTFSDIANVVVPDAKAKELIHGYYACVAYVDHLIGNIINTLEVKGWADNTIIVLWGDHGWHLGDHGLWNKHTCFEQATHVPMAIIDPSVKHQVKKVSQPVEYLDVYPTLCDLAGLSRPSHLDGKTLRSMLTGGDIDPDAYAVSQYPRGDKMGYSIRTARYRYTVWVKWENKKTDINTVYAEELYDYQLDYNETVNVVADKHYSDVLKTMRKHWSDFCQKRIQH